MSHLARALLLIALVAPLARADELKPEHVSNSKGDGPDGKGNTADDTWQFWFELAHKKGQFEPLSTFSTSVPKAGIARKVTGPVAGLLPNPDHTVGWIFHRDWDGRFEGVWADAKAGCVMLYPYVEKNAHMAVAVTYRVPADGTYDISGGVTDLLVQPQFKQHDGIEWIVETADGGKAGKKIGSGGPVGDGNGRPDSAKFSYPGVALKRGQLVRLVIHPRTWWGSDLTRVDAFRIVPSKN